MINVASDAGRVGSSGEAVYSACKGGIIAFSKTLARELARNNIQINTVCPGPTDTPLFASFAGDEEQGRKLVEGLTRAIPDAPPGPADGLSGHHRVSGQLQTPITSPARQSVFRAA